MYTYPGGSQNTIIHMVLGLARPRICKNPRVSDDFGRLAKRPEYTYLGTKAPEYIYIYI